MTAAPLPCRTLVRALLWALPRFVVRHVPFVGELLLDLAGGVVSGHAGGQPPTPAVPPPASPASPATLPKPFFRWGNPMAVFGAFAVLPLIGMIGSFLAETASSRYRHAHHAPSLPSADSSSLTPEQRAVEMDEGDATSCRVFIDPRCVERIDTHLAVLVAAGPEGGELRAEVCPSRIPKGALERANFTVRLRSLRGIGTYRVRVIVADHLGRTAELTLPVTIRPGLPACQDTGADCALDPAN